MIVTSTTLYSRLSTYLFNLLTSHSRRNLLQRLSVNPLTCPSRAKRNVCGLRYPFHVQCSKLNPRRDCGTFAQEQCLLSR